MAVLYEKQDQFDIAGGKKDSPITFLLTTFDTVGLKIDRDVVNDLHYIRLCDGTHRFTITINLPPKSPSQ